MLDTQPTTPQETIQRLIEILQSARDRKEMYFQPIDPVIVEDWLHGTQIGMLAAGIHWHDRPLNEVLGRRGVSPSAESLGTKLARLGFEGERLVDEMLSVEIETWALTLAQWDDASKMS